VIASVVDTTNIFITGDNDISNKFLTGVVVIVCQVSMDVPFRGGSNDTIVAMSDFVSRRYCCFGLNLF
jgi:hypothetical protein